MLTEGNDGNEDGELQNDERSMIISSGDKLREGGRTARTQTAQSGSKFPSIAREGSNRRQAWQ
jgi:hypothetical protein